MVVRETWKCCSLSSLRHIIITLSPRKGYMTGEIYCYRRKHSIRSKYVGSYPEVLQSSLTLFDDISIFYVRFDSFASDPLLWMNMSYSNILGFTVAVLMTTDVYISMNAMKKCILNTHSFSCHTFSGFFCFFFIDPVTS